MSFTANPDLFAGEVIYLGESVTLRFSFTSDPVTITLTLKPFRAPAETVTKSSMTLVSSTPLFVYAYAYAAPTSGTVQVRVTSSLLTAEQGFYQVQASNVG